MSKLTHELFFLTLLIQTTDYCIVAFFIVIVISTVQWFVDGRKNFHGPKIEFVDSDTIMGAHPNSDPAGLEKDGKSVSELNGNMNGHGPGISEMEPEHGISEMETKAFVRSELEGAGNSHHPGGDVE